MICEAFAPGVVNAVPNCGKESVRLLCRNEPFTFRSPSDVSYAADVLDTSPPAVYALFCQKGALALTFSCKSIAQVHTGEMLLFQNTQHIQEIRCPGPFFQGALLLWMPPWEESDDSRLLSVLTPPAPAPLQPETLSQTFVLPDPILVLRRCSWNDALFGLWDALAPAQLGPYLTCKTMEAVYLLCCGALTGHPPERSAYYDGKQTDLIHRIHQYLQEHLSEPMTITDIAKRFPISPTMLKQCFRQTYGVPIHQYLLSMRMDKAAALLRETSMPIVQVAFSVGYRSVSQFGAVFKRRYLCSPLQYRKEQKNV